MPSSVDADPPAVPPLEDINLFSCDIALQEAMTREGGGAGGKRLAGFGLIAGSAHVGEMGQLANSHRPQLSAYDRNGARHSRLHYHPAYHDLMDMSVSECLHSAAWIAAASTSAAPRSGVYVERAGCLYMAAQADAGHVRSISMTHSGVPALSHSAKMAAAWVPKILSRSYDRSHGSVEHKTCLTLALATSESASKGVAQVTLHAAAMTEEDGSQSFALTGVKRHVVAPTADGLIVTASTGKGLSCFLVPNLLPDDVANAIYIRRLIDRVGLSSSACGDVEFNGARGFLLGDEGRAAEVLIETALHARLDTLVVTAALMRQTLSQVLHAAEHLQTGARTLVAQPDTAQTLADMALDAEAAAALAFRLARAFDRATDVRAAAWRRLMTPVSVYWASRRAPALAAEAMDILGHAGTSLDWPLARLHVDGLVAAMADGTAITMVDDVLRILQREPDVAETVMEELGQAAAGDAHLKAAHTRIEAVLQDPRHLDTRGRLLVEALAVLAAGTILRAHAPAAVADAFIMSRMGNQSRQSYGPGLDGTITRPIVQRASPNQT